MKKNINQFSKLTGKKHTIQNIGKIASVINYTNWGTGLLIRNKPIHPNQIVVIQYVTGSFHSATTTQLKTISITDLPQEQVMTSIPNIVYISPSQVDQSKKESLDSKEPTISNIITKNLDIVNNKKHKTQLGVVSIIITNYNTSEYIDRAIKSALNQTYKQIEIIILDDNSTDDSLAILENYKDYTNIHIYLYNQNMGPYWLKNSVIDKLNGEYVTILDSDDVDSLDKIEKQTKILSENPQILCVTCLYERENYKISLGYPSMLWKKEVFTEIGFYDSVKMGADSEFYERFLRVFGRPSVYHIKEVLQRGVRRENGLTSLIPERSEVRNKYVDNFKEWHRKIEKPHISFPLKTRPFSAPIEISIHNDQKFYEITKMANNSDKLPVIMCVWKRVDGFLKIINQLNSQTFQNFKLFVWNNNLELKDTFEKLLIDHADFEFEIHNSEKNLGGFGRFYYGKKIRRKPGLMDYCVFIDDDQTFGEEVLEIFYQEREPKTIKSQYGWKFNGLNYYVNRFRVEAKDEIHYAGTGGMIMDMTVLEDPELFNCRSDYWFVEDLWLSFFSNKIHGYKLYKSSAIIKNGDDEHSLYTRVKGLKTPMLRYLIKEENWNIL